MTVAGDLLTAQSPARLHCRHGVWFLEVVRFVSVDRNVFQPRTQRVEGSEAILQHLKRGDNSNLAASAQQLIRGLRPDEEHSVELIDGEWVLGEPGAAGSTRPSAAPHSGQVTDDIANLR